MEVGACAVVDLGVDVDVDLGVYVGAAGVRGDAAVGAGAVATPIRLISFFTLLGAAAAILILLSVITFAALAPASDPDPI
mmetsp:Transcript_14020/g.30997  ORF Transcript_14020/g.30997 Transcript_14020/m.30997 type:complete len:80 (-) Transcript_14020:178-417(-)